MPVPRCSICQHDERVAIEQHFTRTRSAKGTAEKFGVSYGAMRRHINNGHIMEIIEKSEERRDIRRVDSILDQVRALLDKAQDILNKAEEQGDLRAATAAIREVRSSLEFQARLTGELTNGPTINIFQSPQFGQFLTIITEELPDDVKAQVIRRMDEICG